MKQSNTRKLVTLAFMAAISVILVYLIHFPLFPSAPFLEFDPANIPIFITTFAFGPVAGLVLTVVASVIQGVTVSAGSGWIGILMHIFATGAFVLVAGNLYRRKKTRARAILALLLGTVTMTVVMAGLNLIFTPLFMGTPVSAVVSMMPVIIAFNFLKAAINSIVTFFLYKSVGKLINREKAVEV